MSAEQIAVIVHCAEFDALWLPADEERWCAYLTDDRARPARELRRRDE